MDAAQRFFAAALEVAGHAPTQVTTDGHDAYPLEQDHRSVKQRYYPLRGFGSFVSAARFCSVFEEQRQSFRPVTRSGERVSLAERRCRYQERWAAVMAELAAA